MYMVKERKKEILKFCNNIRVPKKLHKKHKLIKDVKFYNNETNIIRNGIADNLNLKVSNELKTRALRLMNTIFISAEKLGFQIKSKSKDTRICVGNEEVKIGLREKLIRVNHIKNNKDSYWEPRYDYKYSGELLLFIDDYDAPRKNWRDLNKIKLEEMIGDFIIAVIDTADILKTKRQVEKMQTEIRIKNEIEQRKLKKRQDYEIKRVIELKKCVENYMLALQINEYINVLEKKLISIIDENEKIRISKYIEWAKEKSQWINPIIQKEDKVLGKKYDDKLYDLEFKDDEDYSWLYN